MHDNPVSLTISAHAQTSVSVAATAGHTARTNLKRRREQLNFAACRPKITERSL